MNNLRCLSVIVPVYNEVATFRQVLHRILSVPLPKEVIMIDDCSKDGTRDLLKKIEKEEQEKFRKDYPDSTLKFLFHEKNQGKGAALRTGIAHAGGDVLIIQDADLEYDPHEYPRLIEPILSGDADVVYGSRYLGERRRVQFFWHTFGNKLLTLFSNLCTNLNISDMETCYKVFKTEIIKKIPLRSNRFGFEPEITAKVAKLRCMIYEVPISYKGRSYAEGKKINWKDGVSAIYTMIKFWLIDDLYEETAGLRSLRILQGATLYNRWLSHRCKEFLGRRVLHAGAGVGNITKHLTDRDQIVATDVIDFFLMELERTFQKYRNVSIRKLDLLDERTARQLADDYKFDSVLAVNTLEHIEDDARAVENIAKLLPAGGRLVLVAPANAWLYCEMDRNLGHKRRYEKAALLSLLEKSGFKIDQCRYLNMIGAIGWFVNGKIFRRKLLPSRQIRVFDWLSGLLNIEKMIPPPFGLSVLIVAEKS